MVGIKTRKELSLFQGMGALVASFKSVYDVGGGDDDGGVGAHDLHVERPERFQFKSESQVGCSRHPPACLSACRMPHTCRLHTPCASYI